MDDSLALVEGLTPNPRGSAGLRELLAVPEARRTSQWLRRMLQYAIRLEFATIPPYLTAMWSIRDIGDPVALFLSDIVRQEMLHMGLVCNLLNALDGVPRIASRRAAPRYPSPLPGGVHPGLRIGLRRISKPLIANVFMQIEAPEHGPITWFRGQTFPTIGAFYSAIERKLERMTDKDIPGYRQITFIKDDFRLEPIQSVKEALKVIRFIKEQGEGTSGSPLFGSSPNDVSHYYRFGEIYHEKQLKEVAPGRWCYCGDDLPFPTPAGIHRMAPVPRQGYPQSLPFNRVYTEMLHELQSAWNLGGVDGGLHLTSSFTLMGRLGPLAVQLMEQEITPGGETLGPAFHFLSSS